MRTTLCLIGIALLSTTLTACVTYEGVLLHEPDISAMPPEQLHSTSESVVARYIAIGTTGVLREFGDADYPHLYEMYVEYFAMPPVRALTVTVDDLKEEYVGYTLLIRSASFGRRWIGALVPRKLNGVEYAGKLSAVLLGSTGSLVAAVTNEDGLLELTTLLCRPNETSCEDRFEPGTYDARTGREIVSAVQFKDGGTRIDPVTFEKLGK